MPKNSKSRRQRPANNVPDYIVKDADIPRNNSDVVCEGAELGEYLTGLAQDKRLNFDLTSGKPSPGPKS